MQLSIHDTYEQMSSAAADLVVELTKKRNECLICPASGHTPVNLYSQLIMRLQNRPELVAKFSFIGLDEWVGMNGDDPGSCRYSLNEQLLRPLKVDENRISFFDGRDPDLNSQCRKADAFVEKYGRISIAILGVGMNGHIGFNEPGVSSSYRSHITELAPVTKKVGQKYFNAVPTLEKGITLGLATLMESESVLILVSGKEKAPIVKSIISMETNNLPAAIFKQHGQATMFLDRDAASLL